MAQRYSASKSSTSSKTKKKDVDDTYKVFCSKCGSSNQSNFYTSRDKSREFYGKIPLCKNCIKLKYDEYLAKFNDMNLAIYYLCRKIDIPYVHAAYTGALENINNPNSKIQGEDSIVQAYMKNMSFAEQNGWGNCFDDSQGEEQIEGLSTYDIYTKVKRNKKPNGENPQSDEDMYETIVIDTQYLRNKWGDFSNEDLATLESEYMDWVQKLGGQIDEKSIDVIVKQICYQVLDINQHRMSGEDVTKKVGTLTQLMNTSGLIEKQKMNTSSTRTAGQRIEDIEKLHPIKTVNPELDDIDNINNLLVGYIGSTARTLGKNNYYTQKFEELYSPYTIDIIEESNEDKLSEINE